MRGKMLVLAGQTGVGKTEAAFRIARAIPKAEIVVADNIQSYKYFDISGNKPKQEYRDLIKYHNIDTYDPTKSKVNAAKFASDTRRTINEILEKGGFPIVEGGSGFYIKMLLTGGDDFWDESYHKEFDKSRELASKLIEYDKNFYLTLDRLCKLDSTFPREKIVANDNYRLERYLAEAIMFGDKAYEKNRARESALREANLFKCDIYKIFLAIDKIELNEMLNERCEKMVKSGLIEEIAELMIKGIITKDNVLKRSTTPGLQALGVQESLNFLISLFREHQEKDKILASIKKMNRKNNSEAYYTYYYKLINKITWEFLAGFASKNRQYARRQSTWFRNQEDFLWKINKKNYDIDFLVQDILGNLSVPIDEFKKLIASEENQRIKSLYTDKSKAGKHQPTFDLLKDTNNLYNFVKYGFSIVEKYKEVLHELSITMTEMKKMEQETSELKHLLH